MRSAPRRPRRAACPRWRQPPWESQHPRWQILDDELEPNHLARRIDQLVELLDLRALHDSYAGLGTQAWPPQLLLKLALYELQTGRVAPAHWYRDTREATPVQWLLRGARPARSCLYRFRDRLGPHLDDFNRQILALAQAEGHCTGQRGAGDGTFVAALGSRHRLVNRATLNQRLQVLATCVSSAAATAAAETPAVAETAQVPVTEPRASVADGTADVRGTRIALPLVAAVAVSSPVAFPASEPAVSPAPCGTVLALPLAAAGSVSAPTTVPTPEPTLGLPPSAGGAESSPGTAGAATPAVPTRWPDWLAKTPRGQQRQYAAYQRADQRLAEREAQHGRSQRRQSKKRRRAATRVVVSPTEPEAALGRDKLKVHRPLYNVQLLPDLESPFVLGYETCAQTSDVGLLPPLLQRTHDLTGHLPDAVAVDGMYVTALDLAWCEAHDIVVYAPVSAEEAGASSGRPQLPKSAFTWVAAEQTYRCPEGHLLQWERTQKEKRQDGQHLVVMQYRCASVHCVGCPRQAACTGSPERGRTVKRHEHEELVEALRARMATAEGQAVYRLRKQVVELRFADLKSHRGLQQFRSFGLARARTQVALLVLAHNGLALLQARAKQAAATATPTAATG